MIRTHRRTAVPHMGGLVCVFLRGGTDLRTCSLILVFVLTLGWVGQSRAEEIGRMAGHDPRTNTTLSVNIRIIYLFTLML